MDKLGLVEPVHFLKVSHHGSHTGMPPEDIVEKLLPMPKRARRGRRPRLDVPVHLQRRPEQGHHRRAGETGRR